MHEQDPNQNGTPEPASVQAAKPEKKPGFWRRLFSGGAAPEPEAAPEAPSLGAEIDGAVRAEAPVGSSAAEGLIIAAPDAELSAPVQVALADDAIADMAPAGAASEPEAAPSSALVVEASLSSEPLQVPAASEPRDEAGGDAGPTVAVSPPADLPAEVPTALPPGLPPGVPPEVQPDLPPELPPAAPPEVPPGGPAELPPGAPPEDLPELPPEFPPRVPPDLPPDLLPEGPPGAPPELPPDLPLELPPDLPLELPPGLPLELPPDLPVELPPDAPPDLPDAPTMAVLSVAEPGAGAPKKEGFWRRLASGLARTASSLSQGITDLVSKRKLDAETLEDLEDILIRADLGTETAARIVAAVGKGRHDKEIAPEEVKGLIAAEVEQILAPVALPLVIDPAKKPFVLLMVGVNGSGKTTTIGKLAAQWRAEGKKVVLAAGDTFRAAAIEQLKVWGQRTGAEVIARELGADAAGVAFDALALARERSADVLLIDTAGRLQNRTELMAELEKVVRVIKKQEPEAPHAVLLVLDATVGQNALSQVEAFTRIAGVTGLVMTKLDGTARGGILVAIAARHKLPVHLIGVGEAAEDLQPFTARDFARAIAGLS